MIRIRTGELWKRAAERDRPSDVAGHAKGAVGIEVDGVEISGGVLEDLLFPSATALVEAARGLVSGDERTAAVPFAEGAFELVLARRADQVAISLVSLTRPARVLVRDLVVDLEPLSRAALEFAEELLSGLREVAPDALAQGPARGLARACSRLSRAEDRPAPPAAATPARVRSRPPAGRGLAPSVGFDLRDEEGRLALYQGGEDLHALLAEGHVYLHGPDGEELASVSGAPFLVLRDLGEGAARLLAAVREGESAFDLPLGAGGPRVDVDLAGSMFTVGGRSLPCPPGDLARALLEAGLDLCGALVARNPRLSENPYLDSLATEARERLDLCRQLFEAAPARPVRTSRAPPRPRPGGPRLLPGELRRVSLRTSWSTGLGDVHRLIACGEHAWAIGDFTTVISVSTGEVLLREAALAHVSAHEGSGVLLALVDGVLTARGAEGAVLWRSQLALASIEPTWTPARPPGRPEIAALVVEGGALLGIDLATGAVRFRLAAPGSVRGAAAASGSLVAFAADNGVLYGIDASSGETAFQFPSSARLQRVAIAGAMVVAAGTSAGGVRLVAANAATGEKVLDMPLPLREVDELVPVPGGLLVAGAAATGGEVLKVDAAGKLRWRARPILGEGPPSVLRAPGAVFARGSEGVCRIERGRVRWSMPCGPGRAPVLARGVLLLPGERLELLDAATGRPVTPPGAALPAADHVAVHGDAVLVVGEDGSAAGLSISGGLAVL